MRRRKERSRITQHWRLLWGMQDAGEDFGVGESLSLIDLYFRILANKFWSLVCASERKTVLEYMDLTHIWGPCKMAASIWFVEHSGTHLIGYPSIENDCRRGFAQCWVAYVYGHMITRLPIISLISTPFDIEISLLIYCFTDIFICWDVWSKESACVVDDSFILGHFDILGTDVMYLSEVWNYTGWIFDGFAYCGDDDAMQIGIGFDMGGWLRPSLMFNSLSYSAAWYEHEKYAMMVVIFIVTCSLWSVLRVCIIFCAKVPCNSTRKVMKHVLHINVEMKHDVGLLCLYLLL